MCVRAIRCQNDGEGDMMHDVIRLRCFGYSLLGLTIAHLASRLRWIKTDKPPMTAKPRFGSIIIAQICLDYK